MRKRASSNEINMFTFYLFMGVYKVKTRLINRSKEYKITIYYKQFPFN